MSAANASLSRSPAARLIGRSAESGFTIIELLMVVMILAILIAASIPAYTRFSDRAHTSTAESNVREALPAVEAFYAENSTYHGLGNAATAATPGILHYDTGATGIMISASPAPTQNNYCIYSTSGGATFFKRGPGGDITKDPGPVRDDCDPAT